jgi:hypothetical protein
MSGSSSREPFVLNPLLLKKISLRAAALGFFATIFVAAVNFVVVVRSSIGSLLPAASQAQLR